jgi:hypothetical protein
MEILFWLVACNTILFTLIWLVQLVIYPGLTYYNEADLAKWHPRYTRTASLITAPLMLIQLGLYSFILVTKPSILLISGFGLIGIAWLVTFFIAIPLHRAIDQRKETISSRQKLVRVNWIRTVAWTGSFILSIVEYGK